MDDVVFKDDSVDSTGPSTRTSTGPGGIEKSVNISGFEEWTLVDDGRIVGIEWELRAVRVRTAVRAEAPTTS
jgi:hypothetical protein